MFVNLIEECYCRQSVGGAEESPILAELVARGGSYTECHKLEI